ncbi:MAG: outer membrane beta-barrel protein [Bacteroidia bacterium]|nr:outer membrane beta-barrel protein [Bacteroidia bacterium]
MKNIIAFFLLLILPVISFSQSQEYKFTGTITGATSGMGILDKSLGAIPYVDSYSYPAMQATFDYGIKKWFSAGLGGSYQKMGFRIHDYGEITTPYDTITQEIKIDIERLNISARALFHYGNAGVVDMYSGFRIGYHQLKIHYNTNDLLLDILDDFDDDYKEIEYLIWFLNLRKKDIGSPYKKNKFSYQLVMFGIRYYFAKYIGITAEIGYGRPYILAYGLTFRF